MDSAISISALRSKIVRLISTYEVDIAELNKRVQKCYTDSNLASVCNNITNEISQFSKDLNDIATWAGLDNDHRTYITGKSMMVYYTLEGRLENELVTRYNSLAEKVSDVEEKLISVEAENVQNEILQLKSDISSIASSCKRKIVELNERLKLDCPGVICPQIWDREKGIFRAPLATEKLNSCENVICAVDQFDEMISKMAEWSVLGRWNGSISKTRGDNNVDLKLEDYKEIKEQIGSKCTNLHSTLEGLVKQLEAGGNRTGEFVTPEWVPENMRYQWRQLRESFEEKINKVLADLQKLYSSKIKDIMNRAKKIDIERELSAIINRSGQILSNINFGASGATFNYDVLDKINAELANLEWKIKSLKEKLSKSVAGLDRFKKFIKMGGAELLNTRNLLLLVLLVIIVLVIILLMYLLREEKFNPIVEHIVIE